MKKQREYARDTRVDHKGGHRWFDRGIVSDLDDCYALIDSLLQACADQTLIGLDRDGIVCLWSEGARQCYGYAMEEVIGRADLGVLHGVGEDDSRAALAAAAGHGRWSATLQRRCSDGTLTSSRVTLTPRRGASGDVKGYLLHCRDDSREIRLIEELNAELDARAQTEARLRDSHEHYRLVAETAADAVMAINPEGMIVFANGAAERIFGYELETLLGRDLDLLIPEVLPRLREANLAAGPLGHQHQVVCEATEFTGRHCSGSEIPLEVSFGACRRSGAFLFTAIVRDVSERRRTEERFRYLAQYDALTELPNRALLYDRIDHALAQARRNRDGVALLFLDLDDFKLINDTLGHQCGDRLLRSVAQRLRGCLREGDNLGRLGGDEFIICLPAPADAANAALVADKILEALQEPFHIDGHEIHAGISIGISLFPDSGADAETLIHAADVAMYAAKSKGRNSYRFFDPRQDAPAQQASLVRPHRHREATTSSPSADQPQ